MDKTIEGTEKGPILGIGITRKSYFLEDIREISAVAPEIDEFINGKSIEERIAAARKLQDQRVQKKILDAAMNSFGQISEKIKVTEKVLADIFKLNRSYAVYHLCQNMVGNREIKKYHAQYYSPEYLTLLGDSRAYPYLTAQAVNGVLPSERYQAIESLGNIGDIWSAEFLIDIYQQSKDDHIKETAMQAIGKLNAPGVAKLVRELGRDVSNPVLRYEINLAKAQAGDKDAVTELLEFSEKYRGYDPEHIESRLWDILLPKAEYNSDDPSADAYWYRLPVRRIVKNTVNRLISLEPEKSEHIGRFTMKFYSNDTHGHINHLYERFTSLPIATARQYIDAVLPDDEQFIGFVFRMLPSARLYPAMLQILLSERTKRILSSLRNEESRAFYDFLNIPASLDDREAVVEVKDINPKEATLSTGIKVEVVPIQDQAIIYPHAEIQEELSLIVKELGVSNSTLQSVAQIARDHLREKLKRELPAVHVDIIPHDLIMKQITGKARTRMISAVHPTEGLHIGISRENSRSMAPEEFVLGIIHEIYAHIHMPSAMIDQQLKTQDYYKTMYTSHVPFLGEGLANFETGVPLNRELLVAYANGLRDGNFNEVLRKRGVGDPKAIKAIKDDWYRNPHVLGSFLFDTLSRANPQQMWEYVFSFIDRNLNGDYSRENLAKIDFAEIMYDDYVRPLVLLGENPYPREVFFRKK